MMAPGSPVSDSRLFRFRGSGGSSSSGGSSGDSKSAKNKLAFGGAANTGAIVGEQRSGLPANGSFAFDDVLTSASGNDAPMSSSSLANVRTSLVSAGAQTSNGAETNTYDGNNQPQGEPFFIGVAGGTASGKTTVCERIIHNLADHRVVLISQDSFYRGLTEEEHEHVKDYNFDHPNAIDTQSLVECLVTIRDGKPADVPTYDFTLHRRGEEVVHVHRADVVIVEGILVLAMDEVRDLLNLKVFVDTDDDVRLARRIKRDTKERGRDVNGVIEQYTRFVKPSFEAFVLPSKRDADIIIPWARGENTVAIGLIVQHIQSKLQQTDLRRIFPNLHVMHGNFQTRSMHTIIRDRNTCKEDFAFYADRLIRLVVEAALGYLPFKEKHVITPLGAQYVGVDFADHLCGVSMIRSGEAMENALRACCKGCRIGKILIHRHGDVLNDEGSPLTRRTVYERLPPDISRRHVLLMDPVLATGRSVCEAIHVIVEKGVPPSRIIFVSLIASPEGLREVATRFPDITIVTTEIDHCLNEDLKVTPGVGDFGDRYWLGL